MTQHKGKSVLVVEDDEDILEMVSSILQLEGYIARGAKNGYEALKKVKKHGLPDLILLDMMMPVMDGWKFAAEFNAEYDHQAPIVVMTAAGDAKQRAEDIQANGVLPKPFTIDLLLSVIEKFVS
jgi:CheY-like chemotaxis protein